MSSTGDDTIGAAARRRRPACRCAKADWILEGGAIDVDGTGIAVTTEQCLLNPNRNPGMTRDEVEARLRADLGIERAALARRRACSTTIPTAMSTISPASSRRAAWRSRPPAADDPNDAVYRDAARACAEAFGLEVVTLPSPGRVERDGEIIPASYMNFYIGNAAVVVPLYGAANDEAAVDGDPGAVPRPRGDRPARRPCPDRRRQLPLHQPAGAATHRRERRA